MTVVEKNDSLSGLATLDGATFLVNKPKGWTSFDVVKKLRYALKKVYGRKKYKVGHAGTLDPLATGLLIICSGKHTKRINEFQGMTKEYLGEVRLGATTQSYDAEYPEENIQSTDHITSQLVERTFSSYLGTIKQLPPMFSALKKGGKKLYELAREGQTVERKSRTIEILDLTIKEFDNPYITFTMKCSKGTYVRSFAFDVGQDLGVGGYLSQLERVAIGAFSTSRAFDVQELFDLLMQVAED
jgi:tRNA pseudouridine55 synthase